MKNSKTHNEFALEEKVNSLGKGKVWSKYGKFRIYVDRNGHEQAGYITTQESDATDRNAREYKGLFLVPTRPGNYNTLEYFADELLEAEIKNQHV